MVIRKQEISILRKFILGISPHRKKDKEGGVNIHIARYNCKCTKSDTASCPASPDIRQGRSRFLSVLHLKIQIIRILRLEILAQVVQLHKFFFLGVYFKSFWSYCLKKQKAPQWRIKSIIKKLEIWENRTI